MCHDIPAEVISSLEEIDRLVSSPEFSHWRSLRSLGLSPQDVESIPAWLEWDKQSQFLSKQVESCRSRLSQAEECVVSSQAALEVSRSALDFHLASLSHVMEVSKGALADALTWAYQTVFDLPDWSVLLDLEDWRGKKRLSMRVGSESRGWYKLDDLGGSSVFVLGVVIECYYLLYSGLARVVFFDESLSALSQGHLERFLGVLRHFADSLGFSFLVIDHAPHRFDGMVDSVFGISPHPDGGNVWHTVSV